MRICEYCGAEFKPKQKRSRYCSRECQIRAHSLKRSKGGMKTCAWCGKEFYAEYRHTKYCSDKCKKSAYDDKQRQYAEQRIAGRGRGRKQIKADEEKLLCPVCGKEFIPTNGNQIYCSKECCYQFHFQKAKLEISICPHCGKEFMPRNGNQMYCSRECSILFHRKLNQPKSKEKKCVICGKMFTPTYQNEKYCSDECRRKKVYQYHKKPIDNVEKPKEKKLSPAQKRWAKMSTDELIREMNYYGLNYPKTQLMAENNTLPKDFGLKRKRCNK